MNMSGNSPDDQVKLITQCQRQKCAIMHKKWRVMHLIPVQVDGDITAREMRYHYAFSPVKMVSFPEDISWSAS
jgi:hypothetical protein